MIIDCRPEEMTNVVRFVNQQNMIFIPLTKIRLQKKDDIIMAIDEKIKEFKQTDQVYVMCRSGVTSKEAVYVLKNMGFSAVNIENGISGYKKWSGKDFNTLE